MQKMTKLKRPTEHRQMKLIKNKDHEKYKSKNCDKQPNRLK